MPHDPSPSERIARDASAGGGRRALVILGHPRGAASLCGALAGAWAEGARAAGWSVTALDLSTLGFDPDLRAPSPRGQPLEPGLERLRRAIEAADHLVFVYPTWWGTMPALLKGALDRALLPGWAFREIEGGTGFEGLLRGRTAEILTTMDTPAFVYRWLYGAPGRRALARATLGFCGIETVRHARFGPVKDADPARRAAWIAQARALGARLARGPRGPLGRATAALAPWATATRLQFHPMAFLAYAMGALAAAPGAPLDPAAFWLGAAAAFLLEAAAVFVNDLHDFETDRRNRWWSPFTGGSRVLVTGALTAPDLRRGALAAMTLSALCALGMAAAPGAGPTAPLVYAGLAALAIGYTAPPLRLCWRGWGELDVAVTHSFGVALLGAAGQGAALGAPLPWLLSLPLALAVFPAIVLAGVPDSEADRAAGKRTLAVRLGVPRALALAAGGALAAAGSAVALRWGAGVEALAGIEAPVTLHALTLAALAAREAGRGEGARRIDGLLVVALSFILWFCVWPVVALL